jgi:hypothetical protein
MQSERRSTNSSLHRNYPAFNNFKVDLINSAVDANKSDDDLVEIMPLTKPVPGASTIDANFEDYVQMKLSSHDNSQPTSRMQKNKHRSTMNNSYDFSSVR